MKSPWASCDFDSDRPTDVIPFVPIA